MLNFLKKLFNRKSETELPQLSSSEIDFHDIKLLAESVKNPRLSVSIDAAAKIHRSLISNSPYEQNYLYSLFRDIPFKKDDLTQFQKFDRSVNTSLLAVASLNGDGHVREEALKLLLENYTPAAIPFIIFRFADWVSVIQTRAEEGIKMILGENPVELIKHHRLITQMTRLSRKNLLPLHQQIIKAIFSSANRDRIVGSLDKLTSAERFFAIRNLIASEPATSAFTEKILADKNDQVRLLAVRTIALTGNYRIIKLLLKDKKSLIRLHAVRAISPADAIQLEPEIIHLLFDSSAAIRSSARTFLPDRSKHNLSDLYTNAVNEKPTPGNIVGLAEVHPNLDLNILTGFLTSPSPKLRSASLYAISLLSDSKAKEIAFTLLKDPSASVIKTAIAIISKRRRASDLTLLRSEYDTAPSRSKRFILILISQYGGWDIAGDFLKGIAENDDAVKIKASHLLRKWFSYSIRLGTAQQQTDKAYVMGWYYRSTFDERTLSKDVQHILKEIPFIFGENQLP